MATSSTRHYTRFIPGEEIAEAVQWRFGDVGLGEPALLPMQSAEVEQQQVEEAAQAAAAQAQQVHDAAFAEGLRQGQAQAAREWQQRLDDYVAGQGQQVAAQLASVANTFEESLGGLQQQMAESLMQLACDIARQVVRQELQANPRALLPVVREALATFVQDSRPATVRLNPADWQALEGALRDEFGSTRVQWQADASMAPGGCSVECAGAVVDGTLETRWRRAIAALGLVSAWREMSDAD
ncbi:MAG: flagellar assembly protein FliH [Comamonas sp. SCN 65-56]|uniref:FliH/SctL family protein n=1 Tax=Comamonas sp. SCN 65-56 TaxID=1660095 RepID=UPI00086F8B94|nr:FliH/SctL family protein [Comamonas sp. SCN 65-56]ODS90595.1 MAG: flagellar assembly protein FliH [Comamonas sp. SCN 65-56]